MKDNKSIDNKSKDINKYTNNTNAKSVIWNASGSFFNAASSMILLIIVTRLQGNFEGGIFAFAFSVSQLFYTISSFEMRPYQSTDIKEKYSFQNYFHSRIITCIFMMIITAIYIFIFDYTGKKAFLIFLLCLYRMTDAFSDVFQGFFQVKDRLDLAGKSLTLRVVISTIVFFISMILTHDTVESSIYMVLSCVIWIVLFDFYKYSAFNNIKILLKGFDLLGISSLFLECTPLFLGAFLLMYIFNIPKYSIDRFMEDNIQNYFNILFMPVSVINLFSIFLFRPVLTRLAEYFNSKRLNKFIAIVAKLILWIVTLTVIFVAASYFLGIPILSLVYDTYLGPYRYELIIMMVGGGFSAISTLLHYVITVMRKQKSLLIGYTLTAIFGTVISDYLVSNRGILGASYVYLSSMILLSIIFLITLCYYIIRENHNKQAGKYNG